MSAIKVGIIGGSGMGDALGAKAEGHRHEIDTPFGKPSDASRAARFSTLQDGTQHIRELEQMQKPNDIEKSLDGECAGRLCTELGCTPAHRAFI